MKEYQNPILAFFCEHPVGPKKFGVQKIGNWSPVVKA